MYDVIVVGAGPAGSSAARACARMGLRTLLLDDASFPRYKLCGGGITAATKRVLGFRLDDGVVEREAKGMRIYLGNEWFDYRGKGEFVSLAMRTRFDWFLVQKAVEVGAELLQKTRVKSAKVHPSHVEVAATDGRAFEAKALIGADGIPGTIASLVRGPIPRHELVVCAGVEVPVKDSRLGEELGDLLEVEFGFHRNSAGWCYGWVFPKEESLSIGYGASLADAPNIRKILAGYLKRRGLGTGYRFDGHMIPIGGVRRKVHADRVLLVGDAAGFADPITGEGIRYAVLSGQIAGEQLVRSVESDDFTESGMSWYAEECERRFGRDLRWGHRLMPILYNNLGLFFRLWRGNPSMMGQYFRTVTGEQTYEGFAKWCALRSPLLLANALRG